MQQRDLVRQELENSQNEWSVNTTQAINTESPSTGRGIACDYTNVEWMNYKCMDSHFLFWSMPVLKSCVAVNPDNTAHALQTKQQAVHGKDVI